MSLAQAANIRVETEAGTVSGLVSDGVFRFLGLPYGAPITQARRFLPPQPVAPWAGLRACHQLGPVCPQIPTYGPVGTAAASDLQAGEDFLTLNIRSRDLSGRAPVLVWVHGGGYAVGSANEPVLQSGAFAAAGIVEVTVNYRLGALGFLSLPGQAENRGLLDLIAALAWVQRNIAAFGGDPARVTLAGRSAGGFAVAALMAMPAAHGLFARAMPQSGASAALSWPEDAGLLRGRMARMLDLGCGDAGIARLAAALQALPMPALLRAQRDLCNESYERHNATRDGRAAMLGVPFVPVIDGRSLPDHPETLAAAGALAPVPMMIGCTTAEYLTHSSILPSDLDWAGTVAALEERVRPMGLTGAEIVARYRAHLPDHTPQGIWRAVAGDLVFQNPATRLARAHSAHQPVWKYLWGDIGPDETGAAHGAELGCLWYRPGLDQSDRPARQRVGDPALAARSQAPWLAFLRGETASGAGEIPLYRAGCPTVIRIGAQASAISVDPFDARPALWAP